MSEDPGLDPSETIRLLRRAADGDQLGWRELSDLHRDKLRRMVAVRLDQRMQARVDASDVVQDALVEAFAKLDRYLENPKLPFYVWLRSITGHKLMALHRFHLGTAQREAAREVSMFGQHAPEATSELLAIRLVADCAMPSEEAMREELKSRLQDCLESMEPLDREVLMLRHFEQLSNNETADVLGIGVSAASKRYIRAVERFRSTVQEIWPDAGPE